MVCWSEHAECDPPLDPEFVVCCGKSPSLPTTTDKSVMVRGQDSLLAIYVEHDDPANVQKVDVKSLMDSEATIFTVR